MTVRLKPTEIRIREDIFITVFENGDVFVSTPADVTVVSATHIFVGHGVVINPEDE